MSLLNEHLNDLLKNITKINEVSIEAKVEIDNYLKLDDPSDLADKDVTNTLMSLTKTLIEEVTNLKKARSNLLNLDKGEPKQKKSQNEDINNVQKKVANSDHEQVDTLEKHSKEENKENVRESVENLSKIKPLLKIVDFSKLVDPRNLELMDRNHKRKENQNNISVIVLSSSDDDTSEVRLNTQKLKKTVSNDPESDIVRVSKKSENSVKVILKNLPDAGKQKSIISQKSKDNLQKPSVSDIAKTKIDCEKTFLRSDERLRSKSYVDLLRVPCEKMKSFYLEKELHSGSHVLPTKSRTKRCPSASVLDEKTGEMVIYSEATSNEKKSKNINNVKTATASRKKQNLSYRKTINAKQKYVKNISKNSERRSCSSENSDDSSEDVPTKVISDKKQYTEDVENKETNKQNKHCNSKIDDPKCESIHTTDKIFLQDQSDKKKVRDENSEEGNSQNTLIKESEFLDNTVSKNAQGKNGESFGSNTIGVTKGVNFDRMNNKKQRRNRIPRKKLPVPFTDSESDSLDEEASNRNEKTTNSKTEVKAIDGAFISSCERTSLAEEIHESSEIRHNERYVNADINSSSGEKKDTNRGNDNESPEKEASDDNLEETKSLRKCNEEHSNQSSDSSAENPSECRIEYRKIEGKNKNDSKRNKKTQNVESASTSHIIEKKTEADSLKKNINKSRKHEVTKVQTSKDDKKTKDQTHVDINIQSSSEKNTSKETMEKQSIQLDPHDSEGERRQVNQPDNNASPTYQSDEDMFEVEEQEKTKDSSEVEKNKRSSTPFPSPVISDRKDSSDSDSSTTKKKQLKKKQPCPTNLSASEEDQSIQKKNRDSSDSDSSSTKKKKRKKKQPSPKTLSDCEEDQSAKNKTRDSSDPDSPDVKKKKRPKISSTRSDSEEDTSSKRKKGNSSESGSPDMKKKRPKISATRSDSEEDMSTKKKNGSSSESGSSSAKKKTRKKKQPIPTTASDSEEDQTTKKKNIYSSDPGSPHMKKKRPKMSTTRSDSEEDMSIKKKNESSSESGSSSAKKKTRKKKQPIPTTADSEEDQTTKKKNIDSSDPGSPDMKKKRPKISTTRSDSEEDMSIKKKNESSSESDSFSAKKKTRKKKQPIPTTASDSEEDQTTKKKNRDSSDPDSPDTKKKGRKISTACSDSEEEVSSEKDENSSDSSSDSEAQKKKTRSGRNISNEDASDSNDSEEFSTFYKKNKMLRSRQTKKKIKKLNSDSEDDTKKNEKSGSEYENNKTDEDSNKSSSNDSDSDKKKNTKKSRIIQANDDSSDSDTKTTRKKIKKVLSRNSLADSTKKAEADEKERKQRILEKQKRYNQIYENMDIASSKVDKLILDVDEETEKPLLKVSNALLSKLKPHQASGIQFMWDACFESLKRAEKSEGSGCIVAHCMGLGKTLQVIALVDTLLEAADRTKMKKVLVVTPLSTVLNWKAEFKNWLSGDEDYEIYELITCKPQNYERSYLINDWDRNGGVLIMSYAMFRNLSNEKNKKVSKKIRSIFTTGLIDPGPDLVICDEGHLLKNEKTSLSIAMNKIKTRRRIVLTGTPLQNNMKEYYCMVQFVKPNLLGTYKEYLNRFVNPITNGQYTDSTDYDINIMRRRSHVLHKLLDGIVQRRDYSVLSPYLPPKFEYVLFLTLTETQKKLYSHYLQHFARKSKDDGSNKTSYLFQDFQAFSRICIHPRVLLDKNIDDQNKYQSDEEESLGSLKNFIDDESDSSSGSSESEGRDSEKDGGKENPKKKVSKRVTRAQKSNTNSDSELEEEQMEKEWWQEYCDGDELDNLANSTKILVLFEILKECEQIGDKILVFSQSLYALNAIEYFLEKVDEATQNGNTDEKTCGYSGSWSPGLDYFRLDGSTNCNLRSNWCDSFNKESNSRARLFLLSTRAGGLGINLVAANRVIIFDVSWNPSSDIQSIYRVYRFGQLKPSYIYRFVMYGTMEMKIYERQVTKQAISKRVIDEQQIDRHYNQSDLAELYKFEQPNAEDRPIPLVPRDVLLADLLQHHDDKIFKYHEHQSLLENKEDETLNEEERKAAWDEFENEKVERTKQTLIGKFSVTTVQLALKSIIQRDNPTWNNSQILSIIPQLIQQLNIQLGARDMTMYNRIAAEIKLMQEEYARKMQLQFHQYQRQMEAQRQQQFGAFPFQQPPLANFGHIQQFPHFMPNPANRPPVPSTSTFNPNEIVELN